MNSTDVNGNTALHISTESRDVNCLKILLRAGAHVNKRNKFGQNALEYYLSECSLVTEPIAMLLFTAGEIPDESHLERYRMAERKIRSKSCRTARISQEKSTSR